MHGFNAQMKIQTVPIWMYHNLQLWHFDHEAHGGLGYSNPQKHN